jgi:hypothetical protein
MAAKKSCTHLTWNEAKGAPTKGQKKVGKGLSHKDLIVKWAAQGGKFVEKRAQWTKGEVRSTGERLTGER